jgi:hypothetical protein
VLALVVALVGPGQPTEQQPVATPPSATAPVAPPDRNDLARQAEKQVQEQEQREQEQCDDDARQPTEQAPAEPGESLEGGGCGPAVRACVTPTAPKPALSLQNPECERVAEKLIILRAVRPGPGSVAREAVGLGQGLLSRFHFRPGA